MRLKTITAPDMPAAMQRIRDELGENAVILATTQEKGRKQVRVTAALDEDLPPPPPNGKAVSTAELVNKKQQQRQWSQELQEVLQFHNVAQPTVQFILQKTERMDLESLLVLQKLAGSSKGGIEAKVLAKVLMNCFRFEPLGLENKNGACMLVGPPGTGKTLCIAKIATQRAMDKKPVTVITTDNKRAGGVEQLEAFTEILKLDLLVLEDPRDLEDSVNDLKQDSFVIVDTAGCNPYDRDDIKELKALTQVGIEKILTLPAGMDSAEANDVTAAFKFAGCKRLLLTRLDSSRRLGSLLSVAHQHKLAFCNASNSARITSEVSPLDATQLATHLLFYRGSL